MMINGNKPTSQAVVEDVEEPIEDQDQGVEDGSDGESVDIITEPTDVSAIDPYQAEKTEEPPVNSKVSEETSIESAVDPAQHTRSSAVDPAQSEQIADSKDSKEKSAESVVDPAQPIEAPAVDPDMPVGATTERSAHGTMISMETSIQSAVDPTKTVGIHGVDLSETDEATPKTAAHSSAATEESALQSVVAPCQPEVLAEDIAQLTEAVAGIILDYADSSKEISSESAIDATQPTKTSKLSGEVEVSKEKSSEASAINPAQPTETAVVSKVTSALPTESSVFLAAHSAEKTKTTQTENAELSEEVLSKTVEASVKIPKISVDSA